MTSVENCTRIFAAFLRVPMLALVLIASIAGSASAVSGAAFTTFDATAGGCLDSPNGINCNHYTAKDKVYMSGGPTAAGLSNGSYFFAVLTPGSQNGGFVDGATGNLSDTTVGGTPGDSGSGDLVANRTFTVVNHQIATYGGSHATGTTTFNYSVSVTHDSGTDSNWQVGGTITVTNPNPAGNGSNNAAGVDVVDNILSSFNSTTNTKIQDPNASCVVNNGSATGLTVA